MKIALSVQISSFLLVFLYTESVQSQSAELCVTGIKANVICDLVIEQTAAANWKKGSQDQKYKISFDFWFHTGLKPQFPLWKSAVWSIQPAQPPQNTDSDTLHARSPGDNSKQP